MVERILLVAGPQNAGKSTQLRQMYQDPRFGTGGAVPTQKKLRAVALSSGRQLYIRLMSPHEAGDTLTAFVASLKAKTAHGRWCIACAVQLDPMKNMPGVVQTAAALLKGLMPECIRVCALAPDRHGVVPPALPTISASLLGLSSCQFFTVDARDRAANGLLLADTFDFT